MVHRWRTVLLGLSAAIWASPALAQTSTSVTTSTSTALAPTDFTIIMQRPDGKGGWVDLAITDAGLYLNQARCLCNSPVQFVVRMASGSNAKLASITASGTDARLYVGDNCASLNGSGAPYCSENAILAEISALTTLSSYASWAVPTTVGQVFAGAAGLEFTAAAAQSICTGSRSTSIWLWIETTGVTTAPDPGVTGSNAPSLGITLDATPPPAPSGVVVEGGNEALAVSWTTEATGNPDLAGYVVFCMRGDGLVVFNPSYYNYQNQTPYQTGQSLCSAGAGTLTTSLTSSAAGTTTAEEVAAPAVFQDLDPDYLCSNRLAPSQGSTRLRILQNGIPYTVGVAAIDTHGNISPIISGFLQKPVPTVDFYHAYRDAGGQSLGGYCSLASPGSRPGLLVWLAGAGLVAVVIFFRQRRRKRAGHTRGLFVLLILLATPSAQAQVASHEADDESFEKHQSYQTPKHWAFELRFGPYAPNVDSEFSGSPGATPYKTVFGGKRHLMSQVEFDWQIFQAFGSLSAGVVIGYYSQSANAFIADSSTGLSTGERSGDETSLRLIPIAALLLYRWDVAAYRWSIPLVPYGKLGLNYTFWQINDGNGNVPHYLGGQGSGGTPGWQAAAGISLLLDFLDPTAARLLDQETGVNHTYLFFEWNRVDATGLGLSHKLHVGDSRWVLGMMFEF